MILKRKAEKWRENENIAEFDLFLKSLMNSQKISDCWCRKDIFHFSFFFVKLKTIHPEFFFSCVNKQRKPLFAAAAIDIYDLFIRKVLPHLHFLKVIIMAAAPNVCSHTPY